jgi:hypothetical protein
MVTSKKKKPAKAKSASKKAKTISISPNNQTGGSL